MSCVRASWIVKPCGESLRDCRRQSCSTSGLASLLPDSSPSDHWTAFTRFAALATLDHALHGFERW